MILIIKVGQVCLQICCQFPVFLNNSISMYSKKLKLRMLYHMHNTFRNTIFQISVNVALMKQSK